MKKYIVEIEVPSGSRVHRYLKWLTDLLVPHNMIVRSVTDVDADEKSENED